VPLLPRNLGRNLLPWLIINGEHETAAILYEIDSGEDSRQIIERLWVIFFEDSCFELYSRSESAADAIIN
jgi:methionyl-tRNA formyltransferase